MFSVRSSPVCQFSKKLQYNPVLIRDGHGSGLQESTPGGFCVFPSDLDRESKICEKPDLVSSETSDFSKIFDLLLFLSCCASQSKGIKYSVCFFDGCCVN